MVTLAKLSWSDVERLHQRLGRRWRAAASDTHRQLACRQYRMMCRVYLRSAELWRNRERAQLELDLQIDDFVRRYPITLEYLAR